MKTREDLTTNDILYGKTVQLDYGLLPIKSNDSIFCNWSFTGTINGKIDGIEAYVIEISNLDRNWNFRIPNRHLKLEWGHFSGKENETIVLLKEITEVLK